MHASGDAGLDDLGWTRRKWDGTQAYSDSKLHDAMIALALSRLWPGVISNAVDPGWVRTRMGGPGAPDGIELGSETQAWLASSNDPAALASGQLFYRKKPRRAAATARAISRQDALLERLAEITGLRLPG
jgi:NAD(P)-dependent dehydrogenase (short-subunit alcohol dehydrogenase family)